MRLASILLGLVIVMLAAFALQQRRSAQHDLATSQQQTAAAERSLREVQQEFADYKTKQSTAVHHFQQKITELGTAKTAIENERDTARQQAAKLQQDLAAAQQAALDTEARATGLVKDQQRIAAELADTRTQLTATKQQLVEAQKTPPPPALAPPPVAATSANEAELAIWKSRWDNLPVLENRVRELRKQNQPRDNATGNRGVLLHEGRWRTVLPAR